MTGDSDAGLFGPESMTWRVHAHPSALVAIAEANDGHVHAYGDDPWTARGVRAPDQLLRGAPVEPHAALRGVHRLGDSQAERPDVMAIAQSRVPVERHLERRIERRERIGDDMDGGHADAALDGTGRR